MDMYALLFPNACTPNDLNIKLHCSLNQLLLNGELYIEKYEFKNEGDEVEVLYDYSAQMSCSVVLAARLDVLNENLSFINDKFRYLNEQYMFIDKDEHRYWFIDFVPNLIDQNDLLPIITNIQPHTPSFVLKSVSIDNVGYVYTWDNFTVSECQKNLHTPDYVMNLGFKFWFAKGSMHTQQANLLKEFLGQD